MLDQPDQHVLVLVGGVVVQNHVNGKAFGYFLVPPVRMNFRNSSWRCLSIHEPITAASKALRAANNVVVPLVVAGGCARPAKVYRLSVSIYVIHIF